MTEGYKTYAELQRENEEKYKSEYRKYMEAQAKENRSKPFKVGYKSAKESGLGQGYASEDTKQYIENTDFGKSRYDHNITSISDLQNLNESRATQQSLGARVGNSLVNAGVIAATTALDGWAGMTIGLIQGTIQGLKEGSWDAFKSGYTNNVWSSMLQNIQEAYSLPVYKSSLYESASNWDKLGSGAFWGESIIKNAGFMVGAMVGGSAANKVLSKAVKLDKALDTFKGAAVSAGIGDKTDDAADLFKRYMSGDANTTQKQVTDAFEQAAKTVKRKQLGVRYASNLIASDGEARIEAIGSAKQYYETMDRIAQQVLQQSTSEEYLMQKIQQEHPEYFQVSLKDGEMGALGMQQIQVHPKYAKTVELLKEQYKAEAELKYSQYQEQLKSDFNDYLGTVYATNLAVLLPFNSQVLGNLGTAGWSNARKLVKYGGKAKKGVETVTKNGIELASKSTAKQAWELAKIGTAPMSEVIQESVQGATTRAADSYYGDKINDFYEQALYAEGLKSQGSFMADLFSEIGSTMTDPSKWEEGMSAFITSFFGGGVYQDIKEYNRSVKETNKYIEAYNSFAQDPNKAKYIAAVIRNKYYQNRMNSSMENGDQLEYKNAEYDQLINTALLYHSNGRKEVFKKIIDEVYSIETDQDIEDLKSLVKDENGNNPLDNMSNEEIKKYYQKAKQDVLTTADKVSKVSEDLHKIWGDRYSDTVLDEIAYETLKIDNREQRIKSITERINKFIEDKKVQLANAGIDISKLQSTINSVQDLAVFFEEGDAQIFDNALETVSTNKQSLSAQIEEVKKKKLDNIQVNPKIKKLNQELEEAWEKYDKKKYSTEEERDQLEAKIEKLFKDIDSQQKLGSMHMKKLSEYLKNLEVRLEKAKKGEVQGHKINSLESKIESVKNELQERWNNAFNISSELAVLQDVLSKISGISIDGISEQDISDLVRLLSQREAYIEKLNKLQKDPEQFEKTISKRLLDAYAKREVKVVERIVEEYKKTKDPEKIPKKYVKPVLMVLLKDKEENLYSILDIYDCVKNFDIKFDKNHTPSEQDIKDLENSKILVSQYVKKKLQEIPVNTPSDQYLDVIINDLSSVEDILEGYQSQISEDFEGMLNEFCEELIRVLGNIKIQRLASQQEVQNQITTENNVTEQPTQEPQEQPSTEDTQNQDNEDNTEEEQPETENNNQPLNTGDEEALNVEESTILQETATQVEQPDEGIIYNNPTPEYKKLQSQDTEPQENIQPVNEDVVINDTYEEEQVVEVGEQYAQDEGVHEPIVQQANPISDEFDTDVPSRDVPIMDSSTLNAKTKNKLQQNTNDGSNTTLTRIDAFNVGLLHTEWSISDLIKHRIVSREKSNSAVDFLKSHGAYHFVDSGQLAKVKEYYNSKNEEVPIHFMQFQFGDDVDFSLSKSLFAVVAVPTKEVKISETITPIYVRDGIRYYVVGAISTSEKQTSAEQYEKLQNIKESFAKKQLYNETTVDNKKVRISKFRTHVSHIFTGRFVKNYNEDGSRIEVRYLKNLLTAKQNEELSKGNSPLTIVLKGRNDKYYYLGTPLSPAEKAKIVPLNDYRGSSASGVQPHRANTIWLLTKEADGNYYHKALQISLFSDKFYEEHKNDPKNTYIKNIRSIITKIKQSKSKEKNIELVKALRDYLYFPTSNVFVTDSHIIISDPKNGTKKVFDKKKSSVEEIIKGLTSCNFKFNINNNTKQSDLLNSDILKTDLYQQTNVGASFLINSLDVTMTEKGPSFKEEQSEVVNQWHLEGKMHAGNVKYDPTKDRLYRTIDDTIYYMVSKGNWITKSPAGEEISVKDDTIIDKLDFLMLKDSIFTLPEDNVRSFFSFENYNIYVRTKKTQNIDYQDYYLEDGTKLTEPQATLVKQMYENSKYLKNKNLGKQNQEVLNQRKKAFKTSLKGYDTDGMKKVKKVLTEIPTKQKNTLRTIVDQLVSSGEYSKDYEVYKIIQRYVEKTGDYGFVVDLLGDDMNILMQLSETYSNFNEAKNDLRNNGYTESDLSDNDFKRKFYLARELNKYNENQQSQPSVIEPVIRNNTNSNTAEMQDSTDSSQGISEENTTTQTQQKKNKKLESNNSFIQHSNEDSTSDDQKDLTKEKNSFKNYLAMETIDLEADEDRVDEAVTKYFEYQTDPEKRNADDFKKFIAKQCNGFSDILN